MKSKIIYLAILTVIAFSGCKEAVKQQIEDPLKKAKALSAQANESTRRMTEQANRLAADSADELEANDSAMGDQVRDSQSGVRGAFTHPGEKP